MVEIKEPNLVKIEKPDIDIGKGKKLRKGDTKAKSFMTYLISWENIFKRENNKQALILIEEIKNKFLEFYPEKITRMVIIEGWKKYGQGNFPIWKDIDNDFVVEIWHNENKEIKKVKKEDINNMLRVIMTMKIGQPYKCYYVAKKLGYSWKKIWAERMELYFPVFYFPLKILNELGAIRYGEGTKNITRIK